jgi:hypothetical protein
LSFTLLNEKTGGGYVPRPFFLLTCAINQPANIEALRYGASGYLL